MFSKHRQYAIRMNAFYALSVIRALNIGCVNRAMCERWAIRYMGRICYIKPPECWEIKTTLGVLRGTDKEVVAVIIGTVDDYCIDEMVVWMFKEHFNNCVNGQYQIKNYPYSEKCLIIMDSKGNLVEPEQISKYTYIY